VREIRQALAGRIPLIGFSGSPFTLACYMVEGGGSDDFRLIKSMMYGRPDLLHAILRVNARAVADYLNAQIEAGAQAVMVFDTWGGALADGAYQEFSLAYMRDVVRQLKREQDDAVGLDWTVNLRKARARIGDRCALQGNLDPMALFAPADAIRAQAAHVIDSFGRPQNTDGTWAGHVFNLGHGISQFTPPESVAILVEAVHAHSRTLRA
jgi:uroporphyrinogen decarboxylase